MDSAPQSQFWIVYVDTNSFQHSEEIKLKSKAIPVIGRGGLKGCETFRITHFLDNRFPDGGEVVSLTRRSPFTPRNIY
jgi:hypothetical protein